MRHSNIVISRCFLPLAISFFGNLWLWTVSPAGNQSIYRMILIAVIFVALFIGLKNLWTLSEDDKRVKVFMGTAVFALFFNGLVYSLRLLPAILVVLVGLIILYIFGKILVKYLSN